MRFVRISSLIIGTSMIAQWVFFLLTGNVPELLTTPVSIIFHIVIEVLTGLFLITGSLFVLTGTRRRLFLLFCQGMLFYTVINSSGYFAQSGQWLFVVMFAVVLIIAIINTLLLFREDDEK